MLVSLVVHLGLLFSGTFFPPPPAVIRSEPPAERIVLMEMPVLDPDPPEIVHELEPAAGEPAPPMLPDLPTAVPIDAFLEPIQPPPLVTNFGNGIRTIPLAPPGNSFGHGPGMIFEIGAVDETPRARNKLPPNYPPEMHRENIAGEVEVEFVIDARGRVTQVSILHSTHPAFEAPVLAAVQNWTFRPGRKGGRDVNTRVRQIVTFNSSSSAQ